VSEAANGESLDVCGMTGTYCHCADEKGRINFPAKLREQLGATFWIVRGTSERFLSVYSVREWNNVLLQIQDLKGPQGEKIRRWICSGAAEVTPDKQGRILIPQSLRTYAGIQKDVVIAGAGRKAEIWDYNLWKQSEEAFDPAGCGILADLCL